MTTIMQFRNRRRRRKKREERLKRRKEIRNKRIYDKDGIIILSDMPPQHCAEAFELAMNIAMGSVQNRYNASGIFIKYGHELIAFKCRYINMLRDALAKDGINIKAFSVPVDAPHMANHHFSSMEDRFLFELKYGK